MIWAFYWLQLPPPMLASPLRSWIRDKFWGCCMETTSSSWSRGLAMHTRILATRWILSKGFITVALPIEWSWSPFCENALVHSVQLSILRICSIHFWIDKNCPKTLTNSWKLESVTSKIYMLGCLHKDKVLVKPYLFFINYLQVSKYLITKITYL